MKITHKLILPIILIGIVVTTDQLSKAYVIELLRPLTYREIVVLPFLNIVYLWNGGISFGMFGWFKHSNYIFLVMSLFVSGFVTYLLFQTKNKLELVSYSLIVGGAVGNIIDRIRYGKVFDFIYLHINQYYWPAFNVADSAISIGAVIFVLTMFCKKGNDV